jgi:hypothetical protein
LASYFNAAPLWLTAWFSALMLKLAAVSAGAPLPKLLR